jgi:hypothetical protein
MQEGLFGVIVCAMILVWLFVTAFSSHLAYGVRLACSS